MTTIDENQSLPKFFKIEGSEQVFAKFPDGRLYIVTDFDTKKSNLKKELKKDLNTSQVYNSPEKENHDSLLDERPEIKNKKIKEDIKEDLKKSSIEVKKQMETDMKSKETIEDKKIKDGEEAETMPPYKGDDDDDDEKKDTIEVCKKKYDFLIKQSEELKKIKEERDQMIKERDTMKKDFSEMKTHFEKIREKEALEYETKRQDKIKSITKDFPRITEEELKNESYEDLLKLEKRLDMSINRDSNDKGDETEDMKDYMSKFEAKSKQLDEKYFLPL